MNRVKRLVLLLSSVIFLLGCTTPSPRWRSLTSADFPATVRAIITPSGGVINDREQLTYGQWQVSFGSEPPTAKFTCDPGVVCRITIDKLRCTDSPSLKLDCGMHLDLDDITCDLMVPKRKQTIRIRCPSDLALDPGK